MTKNADDARRLGPVMPMTDREKADVLLRWSQRKDDKPAARASQAPGDATEPAPDTGAAHEPQGAAHAVSALLTAQGRMLDDWAEAALPGMHLSDRQQELWCNLHEAADRVREALDTRATPDPDGAAEGRTELHEHLEIQISVKGTRWQYCTRLASDRDETYGRTILDRYRADKEYCSAHPDAEYRLVRVVEQEVIG